MSPCVLSMPGNVPRAAAMAATLGCEAVAIEVHRFPDGESSLTISVNLAHRDVAIVCTLDRPNDKFTELLLAAELARDLGAASVGLIAPYLAYMRQDIRFNPGESVTAKYFSNLVSTHFDWLVTADPHLHRIATLETVYRIPAIAVPAAPAIGDWIVRHIKQAWLIGPDEESRQWVAEVAKISGAPFMVLEKVRRGDHDVAVTAAQAEWLNHRTPVIVDDIASTARTLIAAISAVVAAGGIKPVCIVVHAVFAGDAFADLKAAGADQVISCNTVAHPSNAISLDADLAAAAARLLEKMAVRRR